MRCLRNHKLSSERKPTVGCILFKNLVYSGEAHKRHGNDTGCDQCNGYAFHCLGYFVSANCSRMLEKIISAMAYPIAVAIA